jgi:phospholipid/cholesterol/gamma-HCH transport system substrate-binding protein
MPRTRSLAWAELKVGMLAIFAIVMAAVLIFAVGGTGGFFWQRYPLKATFLNVAGIKTGSPVRVAGVEVGAVTEVRFSGTGVEVWFEVGENMRPLVTDRSVASIGSISLLGEGAIDITAADDGTPVPPWGYLETGIAVGSIAQVTEQAAAGIEEAAKLIADIRAGKGTVGRLFADDSLFREVDGFMAAAQRVATAVAAGEGSLGRLVRDPVLYRELSESVSSLNAITGSIRNGEGSLGRLLQDPALAESLTGTSRNLETMTGRLNAGEGTMGKLLTDDALYGRLDSMASRLDQLTTDLTAGEGTAGQLLHDKQLYENMNQAAAELRSLISDIRRDPKKFLNVKVSIF